MTKFLDFLVLSTYKVSSRSEKKKGRRRRGIIITRPPSVGDRRESSPSPSLKNSYFTLICPYQFKLTEIISQKSKICKMG